MQNRQLDELCPRLLAPYSDIYAIRRTPVGHEVTELLQDWSEGDESALDRLMPLVYDDLRRLAHQHMKQERAGHILQTSALINEAYLRLVEFWLTRPASVNQINEVAT